MELQPSPLPDAPEIGQPRPGRTPLVALVLAVAVVVVTATSLHLGRSDAEPKAPSRAERPSGLAVGRAPRVPYLIGAGLYVHGHSLPGRWSLVSTAGPSTTGLRTIDDENDLAVILRSGLVVRTLPEARGAAAVLSPNGNKAAWTEVSEDDHSASVVLHDLDWGHETGRLPLDPTLLTVDGPRMLFVISVDNDGTVLYGNATERYTWKPGSAPVESPAPGPDAAAYPGFPRGSFPIWLSPDEAWGAWLTDGGVTVQRPHRPATRFTIGLPAGDHAGSLTWESGTDLLVAVDDPRLSSPASYLRCSIDSRSCERAPTPFDP